ncbi:hypothetical protein DFH09DRAFT_934374, partial [Mycena vulgaris]
LLYDHFLTSGDEVRLIWFNSEAGWAGKAAFAINRYVSEAMAIYLAYRKFLPCTLSPPSNFFPSSIMSEVHTTIIMLIFISCRHFIWVFAVASSAMVATFHFIIISRIYALWDRRARIKWILFITFGIEISIATVFTVLAAQEVQPFIVYDPITHMCEFSKKPWALPFTIGTQTVFDLFLIIMTICNALDRPHQKQADVVTSLIHDGARIAPFASSISGAIDIFMLIIFPVLMLANFIVTIIGNPANCFVTMSVVWMMTSIVNSRMQLRFEGLRITRFTVPPDSSLELYQLS